MHSTALTRLRHTASRTWYRTLRSDTGSYLSSSSIRISTHELEVESEQQPATNCCCHCCCAILSLVQQESWTKSSWTLLRDFVSSYNCFLCTRSCRTRPLCCTRGLHHSLHHGRRGRAVDILHHHTEIRPHTEAYYLIVKGSNSY